MSMTNWFRRLVGWENKKTTRKRTPRRPLVRRNTFVPRLEQLEDRLTPANYSWGGNGTALLVQLNTNESVTVSNPALNTETFTLSGTGTDTWTQTGGATASGGGNGTATITFNGAGDLAASIAIDNSIAGAGTNNVIFSSGTIASGSISADTTLGTGTTGSITDSSGATLQATNLALSAVSGIGAANAPITTQVSHLVARMTNFFATGLFVSNTGTLTIGFAGDPFQGVQTNGNGGPLDLTNAGTLNITTSGEIVTTNGGAINLTTTAGDIVTGGGNGFQVNIGGTAGLATLNAAGNLMLGTADLSGNVAGAGPLTLMAGGNIILDFGTVAEAFGAGNAVTATAGGNITLQATSGILGAQIFTTTPSGVCGNISLTTGSGGVFTMNSGAGGQINSGVVSGSGPITGPGNITISADKFRPLDMCPSLSERFLALNG